MSTVVESAYREVTACRICDSSELWPVLGLGEMPLANAFIAPDERSRVEVKYPLNVVRCGRCGLVQLDVVVDPRILFGRYLYSSSASSPLLAHFDSLAAELAVRHAGQGLLVEIGSNDGVLLRPLAARGVRALGVEPASNLAAAANAAGLETWNEFFSSDVAGRIVAVAGRATAVVASNVLAHIDDLRSTIGAVEQLLDDDGVFVAEVPYLLDLLERVEYDTIYHEHLSYFHLAPLGELLSQVGLELFDVRHLDNHGGSVRIYAARRGRRPRTAQLDRLQLDESRRGLLEQATYSEFSARVVRSRSALRELLERLRAEGRRLAGYGAAAKGNILLNYCGISTEILEFVADTTALKQGLLTPGTHIPVVPEAAIAQRRPDYLLLLAWNYADAIIAKLHDYVRSGGRFIHPIPLARVIGP